MKTIPALQIALLAILFLAGIDSAKAQAYPMAYAYPAQQAPVAPRAMPVAPPAALSNFLVFNGKYAAAPAHLPPQVKYAVTAGNYIQSKPYVRGGGHKSVEDF